MQPGENADRMARSADASPRDDTHVKVAAAALARCVVDRDEGAVLRFVNQLEHGLSAWQVNPWRLIEHLALSPIRRPRLLSFGDGFDVVSVTARFSRARCARNLRMPAAMSPPDSSM